MDSRRLTNLAIAALVSLEALWAYLAQPRAGARPPPKVVPIQDGKSIDFSEGRPVVRDDPASKARMDQALKQIDEVNATVVFHGDPTPTPTPSK